MVKHKDKEQNNDKEIESFISGINTSFKDNDFSVALEKDFISRVEWISSGNYAINYACTGSPFKAIPFGRIVSLVGDSGSGKSLLANHILAETQKLGGLCVLFDVERGNYIGQMEKIGIDPSKLIVSGAKMLEDIFEKSIFFVKSYQAKKLSVPLTIVIDSVSQASSRTEMEEGFDKSDMKRAQVIRKGLRMISSLISDNKVCFIIINHLTVNIGAAQNHGPYKVTAGGTAVEFWPSQVIEVNKGKVLLNEMEMPMGMNIRVKIAKSRFFIPFIKASVQVMFDSGIDPYSGLFNLLVATGLVRKVSSAGWYAFEDDLEQKYRESELIDLVKTDPVKYLSRLEKIKTITTKPVEEEVSEEVEEK